MRSLHPIRALVLSGLVMAAAQGSAQQGSIAMTTHNLSVTGPGSIKAERETEICKFCHIPHNAVAPVPMWGHQMSAVAGYQVPRVRSSSGGMGTAPQPDGASRLCLSCHDGTVALGNLGEHGTVRLAGAQQLQSGDPGYLGTDLSGSHPISFVVPDGDVGWFDSARDMGLRPLAAIKADGVVRLDAQGKMQCTTCHDPHSDKFFQPGRVPHFWVRDNVSEVCRTCHELR